MIIEHRTYKIKPGKLNALMELYEKEGMEVHKKILGNQIGYFYTEIGPLNEIVHLYGYESLDDRAKRRKELAENKIWQKSGVTTGKYVIFAYFCYLPFKGFIWEITF